MTGYMRGQEMAPGAVIPPRPDKAPAPPPVASGAVPLPVYTPTWIASCPECCSDLVDEGFNFWCPSCRRPVSAAEVAYFDETNWERD